MAHLLANSVVILAAVAGTGLVVLAPRAPVPLAAAAVRLSEPEPARGLGRVGGVPAGKIRYSKDIQPILSDRCFQCHGPDEAARKAELRLDGEEWATKKRTRSNGSQAPAAIVPGDPQASPLMQRVSSMDPDEVMPPASSHKKAISAAELDLLEAWIQQGAVYESHWAFKAPVRPHMPEGGGGDAWCRTPIDRFALAAMQQAGIDHAPEADKATLIRRVMLDLTGLPPTPEEVLAFVADGASDAYERLVDRLLTTEPYRTRTAERLAAPWLDASRFADTCGIHTDNGRQMWLWRDWVLAAYRDNMPFDQFITEQMAGDLLERATDTQRIASGFLRNHVTTDEGGAIADEYLVEYAVDRASTTSSVLLGLTLGCARCHDHKYDPITAKDFYSFYAFFNSVEEPGLYSQTPDANRAYEPFLAVPTAQQRERLSVIDAQRAELTKQQQTTTPAQDEQRAKFFATIAAETGVAWIDAAVTNAVSTGGATLTPQADGSVLASGANPDSDVHEYTLSTAASGKGAQLLMLEAITDPSLPFGRLGRAPNGNAVLTGLEVEWAPQADPMKVTRVQPQWLWADLSQTNGDYHFTNALLDEETTDRGWAVDSHNTPGGRRLLLLADAPMGSGEPLRVTVRLKYRSMYSHHSLGRVRLSLATAGDVSRLPVAAGTWHQAGPFPAKDRATIFDETFGPETLTHLDVRATFGEKKVPWTFNEQFKDGAVVGTPAGLNVVYMARTLYAAAAAKLDLSLGSDDGFRLFVNGVEAAKNKTERSAQPDQDKASIELKAGRNLLVMKIVNTGGEGAFYYKAQRAGEAFPTDLVPALFPERARTAEFQPRLDAAWKVAFSPEHREQQAKLDALSAESAEIDRNVPRTMVMKELAMPRETFVLTRGQYDHPDRSRPVQRAVPAALGSLAADAPANRLGLAQWLLSPANPLVSRVAVNRMWEMLFDVGIVRTSEDFGLQGEWPSHPELLDFLAVDFRENAWDTRRMLRMMVTSSVYRQSSVRTARSVEVDPENRLLSSYPRRRLAAEQVRDSALHISGLLVERLGGPSVKPYQPEGLWQEVAMLASNTREYVPGMAQDNWRRSIYTYWKRASPPPSLLTFDAPTREFCVVRRAATSTPLQALVLWNDPQYVEAARVLAQRTLAEAGDDRSRAGQMYLRCVGRKPDDETTRLLLDTLAAFRERYRGDAEDAAALVAVGQAPLATDVPKDEIAAWTMLANAMLNLYQTTTQE